MSDPRKALPADRLRSALALTTEAREKTARETLRLDAVMGEVMTAAAKGFDTVTLPTPKGIDLRWTDTWAATATRLKEMGFTVEVAQRVLPDGGPTWAFLIQWRRIDPVARPSA